MILIVGLGNPGQAYQKTKHNFGWIVLNLLQKKWEEKYGFSRWEESKKFKAEISKGEIKDKTIILAKPLTFMNLSGQTVKILTAYYKIKPQDLIIVHDDIDIPLGNLKIVKNRGTAGHKGVGSIVSELGTKNSIRLRIGIQPKQGKPKNVEKFVLLKSNEQEEKIIKKIIEKSTEAIETIVIQGSGKAMNEFNE